MTPADLHTLTGAYAVHALDEDERREFERHVKVCPACAREVAEFRDTAARLAVAVSETPSADLKRRVLDAIVTVRQLPPEVPAVVEDTPAVPVRRGTRFRLLAAAAAVVVMGALGGVAVDQWQDARTAERAAGAERARSARIEAVITAPDAVQASAPVAGGGTGRVIVSRALDTGVVLMSGLPTLTNSQVYQGWYNDDGHMRSIGLIRPGAALVASSVDRASGIGVTVEPAGGSTQPSSDPIVVIPFPSA